MLKLLTLNKKNVLLVLVLWFFCFPIFALDAPSSDPTNLISQQIELLKVRYTQAQNEFNRLQQESLKFNLPSNQINKQLLNQTHLESAVAKSNLDNISIEVSESQQSIDRLQNDIQEIENQLNVSGVFRLKIMRNRMPDVNALKTELTDRKSRLQLEQQRYDYLLQIQSLANKTLRIYNNEAARIEGLLKTHTLLQLQTKQNDTAETYQQEQSYWLQRLNYLYDELNKIKLTKPINTAAQIKIQNDIFYANASVNFSYLQMLLSRYQEQIQQLQLSISQSTSLTLFDRINEQAQTLGKQLSRVNDLLKSGTHLLEKRKAFLGLAKEDNPNYQSELSDLSELEDQYATANATIVELNHGLQVFRSSLDQALQQELSSRQGLPGFSLKAWVDLGEEGILIPSLTFQMVTNAAYLLLNALSSIDYAWWIVLVLLEIAWVFLFRALGRFLARSVADIPDHEFGHINLKWLFIKTLHRNLIDIAVITNVLWLFLSCSIPTQSFGFLIDVGFVWLFFKVAFTMARLCLVETLQDHAGHDVRLYHRLKWTFWIGGIITSLTVFMHNLPVIYEVKDFLDRLFLLFLFVVSLLLIRSWNVFPNLILPYIDEQRLHLRRVILFLGIFIPLLLLINSVLGILGFINLVLTISWYESIFLLVLMGYLILRSMLIDAMEKISRLLIRYVTNGWLWTEAFLKPIDKILRIGLMLSAGLVLFMLYGFDEQSTLVMRLNKLFNYHLIQILNTSITPIMIIELVITVSLFFWAAKWTREFVFRLFSRTTDMGVRNSIAILSQYSVIAVGSLICLKVMGIDLRALTVVAGMFAFGIGLGLRDLANNFVCGFLLLIERPVRVGDYVTISNYEGEVTHIGGRAVTIRTCDHMELLVPNAEIFSKSFVNWTGKDNVVRTVVAIKVNRHDSPHHVQEIIYQVLKEHPGVLRDPEPEVFLKELADGLIEFEVRYYVNLSQVESRLGLRSEVLLAIWDAFEKHNIKAPYPQREIYVKGGSFPAPGVG